MAPRGHLDTSPPRWWLQVDSKLFSLWDGVRTGGWVEGAGMQGRWVAAGQRRKKNSLHRGSGC